VVGLPTALYLTAVELDNAVIAGLLPTPDGGEDSMGLLFAKDSPLVPCVDKALGELTTDGTLEALAVQWLQGEGGIPTITK
jgi:polar amino acid transport system substrate-binding protein